MIEDREQEILYFFLGEADDIHYCILEYRAVDPFHIVKDVLAGLGVIFLRLDGDKLEGKKILKYRDILKENKVPVDIVAGNLWVGKEGAKVYLQGEGPIIQGNELIFSSVAPSEALRGFPDPRKGRERNRLKEGVAAELRATLKDTDIYIFDDFSECLIASKDKRIISSVRKAVELRGNTQIETT